MAASNKRPPQFASAKLMGESTSSRWLTWKFDGYYLMSKDWPCHNAFFFGLARQCQSFIESNLRPLRTAKTVPRDLVCRVKHLHLDPVPHALEAQSCPYGQKCYS